MFLSNFYIFVCLDVGLKFEKGRQTSFFFKYGFSGFVLGFLFCFFFFVLYFFLSKLLYNISLFHFFHYCITICFCFFLHVFNLRIFGFSIFIFCSKINLMEEENPSLETQESVVIKDET
jgi:hypothetical protein